MTTLLALTAHAAILALLVALLIATKARGR